MTGPSTIAVSAAPPPILEGRLQQLLCLFVVLCAIKAPLGVPLYFNAGLLLLGGFALVAVQSLQRTFLWMVVLIGLGTLASVALGTAEISVPRLAQLFLLTCAASLIARLDPDLLGRYLILLLPVIVLVWLVENFLPDPLHHTRKALGFAIHRQSGLHGEPNYSAMLYGVIAVILAQRPPRALAMLPLLLAVPMLSRGVWVAVLVWLTSLAVTTYLPARIARPVLIAAIVALCAQPFVVLWADDVLGSATRQWLVDVSTGRFALWLAYAEMGLQTFGVGYFNGENALLEYAEHLPPGYPLRYAHSLFMQVFGEFGWPAYLVFAGFLVWIAWRAARSAPEQLPLLVFLLTGYALINGLSDWAFWVPLGYVLASIRVAETRGHP